MNSETKQCQNCKKDFVIESDDFDFYDKIKSLTKGYGSLDYELLDYRPTNIVKLDILINGETFDALSSLVFKDKAYQKGRALVEKLKEMN